MEYRNPVYNHRGTIDCEINHPKFGWIPFTAGPEDPVQDGRDLHAAILNDGGVADYVPPPAPDWNTLDTASLNQALAEPGSIVRALGLLTFQEINKLRVKNGDAAYTMQQFVAALKNNIR